MLKVNNLTISSSSSNLVENFSLQIERGETVRLLGYNGTGKTLILTALTRLLDARYDRALKASGDLQIKDSHFDLSENRADNDRSFLVWDQPVSQLLASTPFDNLSWQRKYSLQYRKNLISVAELLKAIRLEKKALNDVSQLSFGEKQLVALAVSLVSHYDFLLLDEVEAHLDPSMRQKCAELIAEFSKDRFVLLTTHNASVFFNQAKTYTLPKRETPDLTKTLFGLLPYLSSSKEVKGYIRNLTFKYDGMNEPILENVSFEFGASEKIVVIGRNGSGKSTFLHLLAKALKTKANVCLPDASLCLQESAHLIWKTDVAEYFQDFDSEMIENILELFPTRKVPKLSLGYRHLLAVLAVGLRNKSILIFDEPDVGLSYEWRLIMAKWFSELSAKLGRTVILSSHNFVFLKEFSPGRIVRVGNSIIEQHKQWDDNFFNETFE